MKVNIKDYEYTIIEVDDTDKDFYKDGELLLFGQTIYSKQLIKIYKNLSTTRKRDVLIHELTHAFFDVYLNSYHIKDKFDEEDIACFMATHCEEILNIVDRYFVKSV